MKNQNKPYSIMKTNYSMIICFRIISSNSVDSKKLTFRDKNSYNKSCYLEVRGFENLNALLQMLSIFVKSNTLKLVILYKGHQCKRNQRKL